jgi:hypothetical protein
VARGTASFLGMPLRAQEQREWEYRSEYVSQFPEALYPWVSAHARDTYAGYYVDHEHGGTIYVGFVGDQEAQIAAFIASGAAVAPERLKSFPTPPRYSWDQLLGLQSELVGAWREPGWDNIDRIMIDTPSNLVRVVTEHVDVVRRLVDERFGPTAPIVVVYGHPLRAMAGPRPR